MEEEVKQAKQGNVKAYEKLTSKIALYLYNIAKPILKNDEDIADAIATTILKGYEKIKTLKQEAYFKTWITRILINECNNILRKNKKIVYIEDYSQQEVKIQKETITQEDKLDLMQAINQLEERTKEVIILYYYNELKIEEIASLLKIPVGTVKSRMNTGRAKLYSLLEKGGKDSYAR